MQERGPELEPVQERGPELEPVQEREPELEREPVLEQVPHRQASSPLTIMAAR